MSEERDLSVSVRMAVSSTVLVYEFLFQPTRFTEYLASVAKDSQNDGIDGWKVCMYEDLQKERDY